MSRMKREVCMYVCTYVCQSVQKPHVKESNRARRKASKGGDRREVEKDKISK